MKKLLSRVAAWLAPPERMCLVLLGFSFAVSGLAWLVSDRFEDALVFFPDGRGRLRGELRSIPAARGAEARAELVAAEALLGPMTPGLHACFPPGVRVEKVLLRKGSLYLDLSEDAALAPRSELERALEALTRSLRAASPAVRRVVLTIGGRVPWGDLPAVVPEAKSEKKN